MGVVELGSVVAGDAVDDMEQQTATQRCGTHNIVHECATRSRDAEELTREDTTSSVMLAMEFEAVETVDTHSSTLAIPQYGAPRMHEEFGVDLTTNRARGRVLVSCQANRSTRAHRQKSEILIWSPSCRDFNILLNTKRPSDEK